jgi:hypothetical protein
MDSGYVEVVTVDKPKPLCEAADCGPMQWGHKCVRRVHGRREPHHCGCGRTWYEPIEPGPIKVRTVSGDLTL